MARKNIFRPTRASLTLHDEAVLRGKSTKGSTCFGDFHALGDRFTARHIRYNITFVCVCMRVGTLAATTKNDVLEIHFDFYTRTRTTAWRYWYAFRVSP